MFNFFADGAAIDGGYYFLNGANYNHIANVLRMKTGDVLLVSDNGVSNLCEILEFSGDSVKVKIIEENYNDTELPVKFCLFQGLPKSDKMELIIQKCVELGVYEIYPVEMSRCVVKIDEKKKASKIARWQSIAESAAKQSKRNTVPRVNGILSFRQALEKAKETDLFLVPYENKNGMKDTADSLSKIKKGMTVGIIIGPEGGFDDKEIESLKDLGSVISLGKRILRTETAAITALGMCMLHTEMNVNGDEND